MPKQATTKVRVVERFANGDERREARWRVGTEGVDSPVDDWRQVRDVDLTFDPVTGETVFSFTRSNARRTKRRGGR
jgi:hypothetical protein